MMGDDKVTLSLACNQHTENEANYAGGRMLFLRDRFTQESNDSIPTLDLVRQLKSAYGNTMTSALWRVIETSERIIFGAISCHPHRTTSDFTPRSLSEKS